MAPPRTVRIGLGAWLACVLLGFGVLEARSARAVPLSPAPADAEGIASRFGPGERGTVVVFVHPRCGCTPRALEALSNVVRGVSGVRTHAVFTVPDGASDRWLGSANWDAARAIPEVTLHVDAGGRLARRAGALKSGHALVFDTDGRLVFAGGAVGAGHVRGDAGSSPLASLLSRKDGTPVATAPGVGCGLVLPEADRSEPNSAEVTR